MKSPVRRKRALASQGVSVRTPALGRGVETLVERLPPTPNRPTRWRSPRVTFVLLASWLGAIVAGIVWYVPLRQYWLQLGWVSLVWICALPYLLLRAWRLRERRRWIGLALFAVGAGLGWYSHWLGSCFDVWRREKAYLAQVERALTAQAGAPTGDHAGFQVGRVCFAVNTGAGPVVGIVWQSDRGTLDALVYDPAGQWAAGSEPVDWLAYAGVAHLFGPWYRL